MTQVVLNIENKTQWDALQSVLEEMGIPYITQNATLGEAETALLHQAQSDVENGRVHPYTNHRAIIGR
jgi:hypothetical protein